MKREDFENFASIWGAIYEMHCKQITPMAIDMAFAMLKEYTLSHVRLAVIAHGRDSESGKFPPKPADIICKIDGAKPTSDEVIAMARLTKCPFGVLARISIGSWDLNNQDAFYLRQRATECLQEFDSMRKRVREGYYTAHEIDTLQKFGVDPFSPFLPGALPTQRTRIEQEKQPEKVT